MMRRYSFFLLILCLLAACGDDARIATVLNRADSLMNSRPDSALTLLDSALHTGDASDRQTARLRLRRLNAINKLDTVFTEAHVAQASELVTHFDRHGTPNERMLAHYLLGRTYADAGQAPQAIQSYLEAAECADTTSVDCDYRQLCFVYSQMGDLFYRQNLYHESLRSLNKAVKYGYEGKDTLHALLACAFKVHVYSMLSNKDSVLIISENTSNQFRQVGYGHEAASILLSQIRILVERGLLNKAHQQMIIYERESGFFDDNCEIESGREVYYYVKGTYYLAIGKNDSAEYYFRKEIATGRDFNNQNAGSRGLALLFQQTHRPDSAAKYALYSYAMNDSVYAQMATRDVNHMKAIYDYSHFQRVAEKEKEQAEKERSKRNTIILSFLFLCAISGYFVYRYKNKQRELREEQIKKHLQEVNSLKLEFADATESYKENLHELQLLEESRKKVISIIRDELHGLNKEKDNYKKKYTELKLLKDRISEEYEKSIEVFRKENCELNEKIETLKQQDGISEHIKGSNQFVKNEIVKQIKDMTDNPLSTISPKQWENLIEVFSEFYPVLYKDILSCKLNVNCLKVCILTVIGIRNNEQANLVGLTKQNITNSKTSLNEHLFKEKTSRTLNKNLVEKYNIFTI
ncbi:MAG: hypothetical protein IKN59_02965 [Paludibacteraceae bacterium]|nr:hypothetical protein [Paludibacteraceae bacterium]